MIYNMPWDEGLTGHAWDIAAIDSKTVRVMAGPGTGKTFALMRRVARLLEAGIDPSMILAVTFTRTAAADLKKSIENLNVHGSDLINARTLHSLCFSVLQEVEALSYLGRFARPIVTFNKSGVLRFEAEPILVDLGNAERFGTKRDKTKRIRAFEAAWARLQCDIPGWPQEPIDHEFHNNLVSWLKFHEAILIGELVPEALRYLRNNPECKALSQYRYVVVDEYQDLNNAEQTLIDLISASADLIIVGDENQSIYGFRFAHPEGIIEFSNQHPDTHDINLIECRRCPQMVVDLANSLILQNHPPGIAPIITAKDDNPAGDIAIVQWASLEQEAQGIADYVNYLIPKFRSK
ncbi:MAG: ATP-dependent helicase [Actinomycetota bacterium]|nr:ATP-dependent helicase [Actinomycetota bacterium]